MARPTRILPSTSGYAIADPAQTPVTQPRHPLPSFREHIPVHSIAHAISRCPANTCLRIMPPRSAASTATSPQPHRSPKCLRGLLNTSSDAINVRPTSPQPRRSPKCLLDISNTSSDAITMRILKKPHSCIPLPLQGALFLERPRRRPLEYVALPHATQSECRPQVPSTMYTRRRSELAEGAPDIQRRLVFANRVRIVDVIHTVHHLAVQVRVVVTHTVFSAS